MKTSLLRNGNGCVPGARHFRRIGGEMGRLGMKDREEIIPLLHTLKHPTFFTRDHGFYHPTLLHAGYCLVHLDVDVDETASYIRRFLRHKPFQSQLQRRGKIVQVRHSGGRYWQMRQQGETSFSW